MKRFLIGLTIFLVSCLIVVQIGARFLLKPVLMREGRRLFQVPVSIEKAGINVLSGSFWMERVYIRNPEGYQSKDFLYAKRVGINWNLASLLTHKLVIDRVQLEEPVIHLEQQTEGNINLIQVVNSAVIGFQQRVARKHQFLNWIEGYELEQFKIKGGSITLQRMVPQQQKWLFEPVSFSLARIVYPPNSKDQLPVQMHLEGNIRGARTGHFLLIGRINLFSSQRNFDLRSFLDDIILSEYDVFFPGFPLEFADGVLELKSVAKSQNDQVVVQNDVELRQLKFQPRAFEAQLENNDAFGFPAETVVSVFNDVRPGRNRLDFDFKVKGDFSDPNFDLLKELKLGLQQKMKSQIELKIEEIKSETKDLGLLQMVMGSTKPKSQESQTKETAPNAAVEPGTSAT